MSQESGEQKKNQKQTPSQLNLKSIQPQEQLKRVNKSRPAIDAKDKDIIKKKRKLLSFQQQQQAQQQIKNQKNDKIKRADNTDKNKVKHDFGKQSGKGNIQQNLKAQFNQKIEKLKQQLFQFDYSYWDGPQVIKKLKRKKKQTVKSLMQICRLQLITNFQNLASFSSNDMLMVIKDLIVPHKMTIADIQALQLKTAKGDLLLNFKNVKIKDMILSVNVQSPIRIIQRSKYEKNISSYPFNTWRQISID